MIKWHRDINTIPISMVSAMLEDMLSEKWNIQDGLVRMCNNLSSVWEPQSWQQLLDFHDFENRNFV